MIGLDSYDSGTKATWRGWQWNRIVERLPEFDKCKIDLTKQPINNRIRDVCSTKVVVYLCGPDDVDREHGLRLGFRNENMIAVDIEKERVDKARKRGAPAVCGTLEHVVTSWNMRDNIDVLIADFCCGLQSSAANLLFAVNAGDALHSGSVVSINLFRGRDPQSKVLRSIMEDKNRAQAWWLTLMVHWQCATESGLLRIAKDMVSQLKELCDVPADIVRAEADRAGVSKDIVRESIMLLDELADMRLGLPAIASGHSRLAMKSYKSGRSNIMDSAVGRFLPRNMIPTREENPIIAMLLVLCGMSTAEARKWHKAESDLRPFMAALKAIRTKMGA